MKCLIPALTALALVAPDSARETHAAPAFDPRAWRGTQAGAPTEVLTLGSPHLSGIPAAADSSLMDALLDKLAVYKPDIITVENVSGEQCDHLRLYAGTYPESFDTLRTGRLNRRQPIAGISQPCSWPPGKPLRRSCNGFACRRRSAIRVTA